MSFLRYFRLSALSKRQFLLSLPEDADSYSTDETSTPATWLGRTIYRKVLLFPNGPNAIQLVLVHNIADLDFFTSVRGFMLGPGKTHVPLPYVGDSLDFDPNTCVSLDADQDSALITPIDGMGQDWSSYSGAVILEYVKTP